MCVAAHKEGVSPTPPVVIFRDDNVLWLADGFHRWHAHAALGLETIAVEIYDGSRRDALLYSLPANASHGLQRKPLDYKRAYEIACRNGLVEATDSEAVAALLHCSGRWGTELTEQARVVAKAARDAAIVAGKETGRSNRDVAREVGVDEGTVRRVSAEKRNSAEIPQPAPILSAVAARKLDELASPPAQNWSAALRALRDINEQVSVDELFAERFAGFDHVFEPELAALTALAEIPPIRQHAAPRPFAPDSPRVGPLRRATPG